MKKIIFIFIFLLALTGCSQQKSNKQDNNKEYNQNQITGENINKENLSGDENIDEVMKTIDKLLNDDK